MRIATIEDSLNWRVESHGNGLAYSFTHKPTGAAGFLQGEDAAQWRDEWEAMGEAHERPETTWNRLPWDSCLAELCGAYVELESQ